MAYVQMKCPSCGAGLEIDSDGITKFCPYCGTKLMFDADTLSALLVEREKTAQARERTARAREATAMERQKTIQSIFSNSESFIVLGLLVAIIVIVIVLGITS